MSAKPPLPASGREWIDGLRQADGSLAAEAVRAILPYGEAFLFVERVAHLGDGEIEASYRIPADTPWIEAHFVGFPVMPGALIAEGFGQAGSILVRYGLADPAGKDVLGIQIESARFLRPAFPGDSLIYEARLDTMSRRAARVVGGVRIGEQPVAKLRMVLGIADRGSYGVSQPPPSVG